MAYFFYVFTVLRGMQMRSSDEKAVRPSVRLSVCLSVHRSNTWIMTKWKKDLSRFFIPYKRSFLGLVLIKIFLIN